MLKIYLLGHIHIHHTQPTHEIRITPTVQALLAYLLLHPYQTCSRELLTELGWADRPPEQAHACLNTALWRLRQCLEPKGVQRGEYLLSDTSGDVSFNWNCEHFLDLEDFEGGLKPILATPWLDLQEEQITHLESLVELYRGDLLEGLYADWVISERERLRLMYLKGLYILLHTYKRQGHLEHAIAIGQQILRCDPLREDIHRELMATFHQNGQRVLAVQQYEICRDLLKKELGILPMAETRDLHTRILKESSPLQLTQTASSHLLLDPPLDLDLADTTQIVTQLKTALADLDQIQQKLHQILRSLE